jgi:hypothetical protein
VGSEDRECFSKVSDDFMRWRALPSRIARSDENPQTNASRRPGLHIAHFVAQNRASSGIERQVRDSLQEHSRIGFAPWMIATVLANPVQRMIRAVIDSGDRRALRLKAFTDPTGQIRVGLLIEIAAAGAGLVTENDDRPPHHSSRSEPIRKFRERIRIAPGDGYSHGPH